MAEAPDAGTQLIDCAGFRIEIKNDELRVTPDGSASTPFTSLSPMAIVMHILVLALLLGKIITAFGSLSAYADDLLSLPSVLTSQASLGDRLTDAFSILLPILLMSCFDVWYAIVLRRGEITLHCTREKFELLQIYRGQVRSSQVFLKSEVQEIQYGGTTWSTANGIVFTVSGRKRQIFKGMKCVEADEILTQLARLGYSVVHDVGMPMMVEMEKERRKSWLA